MKKDEIVESLNNLPKGYISKKKIHGKVYNYLQYIEEGKIKSQFVSDNRIDDVYSGLQKRKELEKLIDKEINSGKKLPVISNNARSLTGSLMMEDEEIASFVNGEATYINNEKCPLLIKKTRSLAKFLSSRVIDSSRTNARILKKAMSIKERDDCLISLYSYGSVITDNYWFRPKQSKLKYKDIKFDNDSYAETSLTGNIYFFPKSPRYSPQLTLGGSYEKCWKYENNEWYLYKKENKEEIFSEILSSEIAKLLGIDSATYTKEEEFIKTKNFAEKYNFEPMSSIAGDDDSYEAVYNCLKEYGEEILKQYLKLIWFDCLVNNVDRHNENCGLLRDKKTGRIISLAPNFDNNMSLISRSTTLNLDPNNDGFIKIFLKFINNNKEAKMLLKQIKLKELKEKDLYKTIKIININVDEKLLVIYLMRRDKYLRKLLS